MIRLEVLRKSGGGGGGGSPKNNFKSSIKLLQDRTSMTVVGKCAEREPLALTRFFGGNLSL